jgi:hypothetical protein
MVPAPKSSSFVRKSLAKAVLAFVFAFGIFLGGFATVTTAVLYGLFLLEARSGSDFLQFLMSGSYYRIFFAILFLALVMGGIWFFLVLIANLRFDERGTNGRIDGWLRRMERSDKGG